MSYITRVRLCVDTAQPIDPGNYDGTTHCLGHPEGHDCITAMFDIDRSTLTFESQRSPYTGLHVNAGPLPGEPTTVLDGKPF